MIDRDDLPSVAAILLADRDAGRALDQLGDALAQRRYSRHDTPPPAGYPVGPYEWLGFYAFALVEVGAVALVPRDPGLVFEIARWISAAFPDELVVAWRRLRGDPPVAKFLVSGAPCWKDGADADLEVGWKVPAAPSVDLRVPPHRGLPDTARAAELLLDPVIAPWPRDGSRIAGVPAAGFVERRSPLAG